MKSNRACGWFSSRSPSTTTTVVRGRRNFDLTVIAPDLESAVAGVREAHVLRRYIHLHDPRVVVVDLCDGKGRWVDSYNVEARFDSAGGIEP